MGDRPCGARSDNFLKEPGTQISGKRVLNDNWRELYFKALGQAKLMVIFLTEGYFESEFCSSDITAAVQVRPMALPVVRT